MFLNKCSEGKSNSVVHKIISPVLNLNEFSFMLRMKSNNQKAVKAHENNMPGFIFVVKLIVFKNPKRKKIVVILQYIIKFI